MIATQTDSAAPGGTADLDAALTSRRWLRRSRPFPHFVVHDVFRPEAYARLVDAFNALLRPGGDGSRATRFGNTLPGYDASAYLFGPDLDGPLAVFVSRAWRDLLAGGAGIRVTEHVSGALHHHRVGSADGELHTDFSIGWFARGRTREDGVVVADNEACAYWTGAARRPGVTGHPMVRAVAVLYYLANPRWLPGDGGETGLYASANDPVRRPAAVIPPVSNSMVVFECTPWSLHSFLSNRRTERNCVAMFLHRSREDATARWGAERITGGPDAAMRSRR